jgi:hypothetical protein
MSADKIGNDFRRVVLEEMDSHLHQPVLLIRGNDLVVAIHEEHKNKKCYYVHFKILLFHTIL